ncbi:MAG: LysR family transcriptional regulator [Deltaproteobacteria bacterium]|nr:LysR family transcriptional regulator [Deltaproteobacteria bacterium]
MEYTLEEIKAFIATADAGSFSNAGRRLKKAQSTISTAVMNLEIDLGVTLFKLQGRLPVLTEEGQFLYHEAKTILKQCQRLQAKAKRLSDGQIESHLSIAIDELMPPDFTVNILSQFGNEFPNVDLQIFLSTHNDIAEMLKTGKAALGILVPFGKPPSDFQYKLLANMEMYPVACANHPLAKKTEIAKEELAKHRQIVVVSRGGLSLDAATQFTRNMWEMDSYYIVWDLVRNNIGWAFLPDYIVGPDLSRGRLKRLPLNFINSTVSLSFYLAWIEEDTLGKAAQWLLKAFDRLHLSLIKPALGRNHPWPGRL